MILKTDNRCRHLRADSGVCLFESRAVCRVAARSAATVELAVPFRGGVVENARQQFFFEEPTNRPRAGR